MILQTKNLQLKRDGAPLLAFADLAVDQGDSLLLLGPSGSGKTTLLSMLAGLLPPTGGTVHLHGNDFYAMPPQSRDHQRGKNFGFIFQTLHLLPSLTIRKNILLAAQMADLTADEDRVTHLLQSLGIANKTDRKPHELSQGERQRAAIARAVFNRPAIIIADEPTSALDDANAQTTMDLIESQARESGAALIVATHDNRIINRFKTILTLQSNMAEAA